MFVYLFKAERGSPSKHITQTMTCQGTKETFQAKASRSLLDLLTVSKIRDEGQKGQAKDRTRGNVMHKSTIVTQLHVMGSQGRCFLVSLMAHSVYWKVKPARLTVNEGSS